VIRPLTIALVLVAGMAVALVVTSQGRTERRELGLLESLTSDDGFVRRAAWESFARDANEDRREEITARLADPSLSRAVLADAARGCLDLGWPIEPTHAIAAGEFGDADAFLAWFGPALRSDDGVLETSATAIRSISTSDRRAADDLMMELVTFAGSPPSAERVARIAKILDDPSSAPATRIRLALGRLGAASKRLLVDPDAVEATRGLFAAPDIDAAAVLDVVPVWVLANAGDAAQRHLDTLASEGDADAIRAIGLASADRVAAAERAILADPAAGYDRRSLAALRLLDHDVLLDEVILLNLLDAGPADGDGCVHAAALIAWRGLARETRTRLLARWIEGDDLDRIRAGVMLAAICHALDVEPLSPTIIAEIDRLAIESGGDPRTRRTARLATRVLERWPHDDLDAASYAARTTRLDDGRLDADTVLLGMLAGDPDASRRLTTAPRAAPLPDPARAAAFARDVAWRRAIVSSLAPDRFRIVGEPIPGDENDLRLWIEALAADRLVSGPFRIEASPIADSPPLDETLQP
jgi:hypothetical protein